MTKKYKEISKLTRLGLIYLIATYKLNNTAEAIKGNLKASSFPITFTSVCSLVLNSEKGLSFLDLIDPIKIGTSVNNNKFAANGKGTTKFAIVAKPRIPPPIKLAIYILIKCSVRSRSPIKSI